MELHSQKIRVLAPENDPLKIGMGWTVEDLFKPQILVESTFETVIREAPTWISLWKRECGQLPITEEKEHAIM